MSIKTRTIYTRNATETTNKPLSGSLLFDWLALIGSGWMLSGFLLEGWIHDRIPHIDALLLPWDAIFYSGLLAIIILHSVALVRYHARGYSWVRALPPGYGLALPGCGLVLLSNLGDIVWEGAFGIEKGFSALLSPVHLLLACGLALIVSGPLRAAWQRPTLPTTSRWLGLLPMLLSVTLLLSLCGFFTELDHPFVYVWSIVRPVDTRPFYSQAMGIAGVEIQTALLMGCILFIMRRWQLPFGALTLIFTLNLSLVSSVAGHNILLPVGLLTGIAADLLLWLLQPSTERTHALRLFAFCVPALLFLLYFLAAEVRWGLTWNIHLSTGCIMAAGIVGLLLSYAFVPPRLPANP